MEGRLAGLHIHPTDYLGGVGLDEGLGVLDRAVLARVSPGFDAVDKVHDVGIGRRNFWLHLTKINYRKSQTNILIDPKAAREASKIVIVDELAEGF